MDKKIIKEKLVEYFLKYVAIPSQSNEKNQNIPSSSGQLELGKVLRDDLIDLGLKDISINDFGVLQARLPQRGENMKKLGWVAHLDTVDVGLASEIHPQIIKSYDGSDINLGNDVIFFYKR